MAIRKINITQFLEEHYVASVLDVRSPAEFEHAHIPNAKSFPIFTNQERHEIGTAYKQQSRETAIKLGLNYFGKNLVHMIEQAEKLVAQNNKNKQVIVHCWRGGMRSAAMAWLLDLYGFNVSLLEGGYKSYRKWALEQFQVEYNFTILGGYTGSNKTGALQRMMTANRTVIDLEFIAQHKGSSFGNLDLLKQPSQEQFENQLALELFQAASKHKKIWLEGESQRIGAVNIPPPIFQLMLKSDLFFLQIPFEQRLQNIVTQYGTHAKEKLINAIVRIKKRLGGLETKNAINFLLEEDVKSCISILLQHYDKAYLKSQTNTFYKERKITMLELENCDAEQICKKLISYDHE